MKRHTTFVFRFLFVLLHVRDVRPFACPNWSHGCDDWGGYRDMKRHGSWSTYTHGTYLNSNCNCQLPDTQWCGAPGSEYEMKGCLNTHSYITPDNWATCPRRCRCMTSYWKETTTGVTCGFCPCLAACAQSLLTNGFPDRDVTSYTNDRLGAWVLIDGTATFECASDAVWWDKGGRAPRTTVCKAGDDNCRYFTIQPKCVKKWCAIPPPVGDNTDMANFEYDVKEETVNECTTQGYTGWVGYTTLSGQAEIGIGFKMKMMCEADAVWNGTSGSDSITTQTIMTDIQCVDGDEGAAAGKDAHWDFDHNDPPFCVKTCPTLAVSEGGTITYVDFNDTTVLPVLTDRYIGGQHYAQLECAVPFQIPAGSDGLMTCQEDGTWDQDIECTITCFALNETDVGSNVDFDNLKYTPANLYNENLGLVYPGGKAKMECATMHQWDHDIMLVEYEVECDENGTWPFPFENCTAILGPCDKAVSSGEKNQRIVAMSSATLSSTALVIMLIVLLVIFILLLDVSLPRLYHMIQEASLLASFLLIVPARSRTVFDMGAFCDPVNNPDYQPTELSLTACTIVAISLHYLFLVLFWTLLLESLHNYTIYTMVFTTKPLLNRPQLLAVALLCPVLIVLPSAVFMHDQYVNDNTCWLNYDNPVAFTELVPMFMCAAPAVIISEATTMYKYPVHCGANDAWRLSAATNSKGGLVVSIVAMFAWFFGSSAVHNIDLTLYMVTSILNTILGVTMVLFHTMGSARARKIITKICCCCYASGK